MVEKRNKKPRGASLGLTALLLTGSCGMPHSEPPNNTLESLSEGERLRTTFLRALYDEVHTSLMQYSPSELAPKLVQLKEGVEVSRVDAEGSARLYIRRKYSSPEDTQECLSIDLQPLLKQLKTMQELEIVPPSPDEVRDVFLAGLYQALGDKKFEGMTLEGFNVQQYLGNKLFAGIIDTTLKKEIERVISNGFPEMARAVEMAANTYTKKLAVDASGLERGIR